jgi:hypothetical protein
MALITSKKIIYKISTKLRAYLEDHGRHEAIPVNYSDLLRYDNAIPLYDKKGSDTLWETVFFAQSEANSIHNSLKYIYSLLKGHKDLSIIEHLYIDRIDLCVYGNTQPFRIRIVNRINDNFDYFYVKNADASRIYGLELEHHLSPNKINFLVDGDTLVEEHIAGIPGDAFMKDYLQDQKLNHIRIAKEFVKFNERCFVRLLGDMHSSNFVVDLTPDFEEIHYRIRAIDFDQQSYEGRKAIYLPQFYKQNNPLIQLGIKCMTPESMKQYQREERSFIATRIKSSHPILDDLLKAMCKDTISKPGNVENLRKELAAHYKNKEFLKCKSMGDIVKVSLNQIA